VLAAHPKVVAALGIAATVALLLNPFPQQTGLGLSLHASSVERALTLAGRVDEDVVDRAQAMSGPTVMTHEQIVDAVGLALQKCGKGCSDLTPTTVLNDPELLQQALFVQALDQLAETRTKTRLRSIVAAE